MLDNRTILQVWKGGWQETTKNITAKGYKVILSSPFYLNYISYGIDWPNFYKVNPTDFGGDEHQQKMVLGGETCLWGEYINKFNLISIGWPRSSVVAERLWSAEDVTDVNSAAERLQEHTCRMMKRGHQLAPANGPNYCWSRKIIFNSVTHVHRWSRHKNKLIPSFVPAKKVNGTRTGVAWSADEYFPTVSVVPLTFLYRHGSWNHLIDEGKNC